MSFISQNAPSRKRPSVTNAEEEEQQFEQQNPNPTASSITSQKKKKNKKRNHDKHDSSSESGISQQQIVEEVEEMKKLEGFLFGSLGSSVDYRKEIDDELNLSSIEEEEDSLGHEIVESEEEVVKKPAWVDEEEEKLVVDLMGHNRLRKLRKDPEERFISGSELVERFRVLHSKMNPNTDWARKALNDEEDEDDGDILRSNEDLVVKSQTKLSPGILEFSRLANANSAEPSNAPIHSVEFHKNGQLLLTGGLDRRIRLFQIDGIRNPKIDSIFLEDCPIRKAAFLPNGSGIIASGRRKFFYSWDLQRREIRRSDPLEGSESKSLEDFEVSPDSSVIGFVGAGGYIKIVSSKTMRLLYDLKMNGSARTLSFTDDGRQLVTSGGDGHIYHWDLRTRRCFHKGVDEGCITSSALSVSHDGSILAAGSDSGVVNVYNRSDFVSGRLKPMKALHNLSEKIDGLKFNHDGQILAAFSSLKANHLKLIHLPTLSVFSNWPPARATLQNVTSLDFGPGGGFMAVGNAGGKVLLYELHHYEQA